MIIARDARQAFQASKVDPELKRLWQNPFAARFIYDDGLSGTLFFQADSLSYDTIAHEIFHVVHRLMEQLGDTISPQNHEAWAYLMSYLVKWTIKQCRAARIKIHDE
jgi:hypothetical protein